MKPNDIQIACERIPANTTTITKALRGYSGHGQGVPLSATSDSPCRIAGISGIAGESTGVGGRAYAGTVGSRSPIGQSASRFEVFYEKGKKRGTFAIEADGEEVMTVNVPDHYRETVERDGETVPRFELVEATDPPPLGS